MLAIRAFAEPYAGSGPNAGSRGGRVSDDELYTRAAIEQAGRQGMSAQRANSLVRRNAATSGRQRVSNRAQYLTRQGLRA